MATPASTLTPTAPARALRDTLRSAFTRIRARSGELVRPLSAEDACVQSMPDASPAKWHLAHVTWFFETFVLEPHERGFKPFHSAFRELFNSYYNGVGKQFSRPDRGLLTRPSLAEVLAYRADVDARVESLLDSADTDLLGLIELGLQHEQQHQELLLMDIKHLLSRNPLSPAYQAGELDDARAAPPLWIDCEGGLCEAGHRGDGFHFDNETPRHRVWLEPYQLASRLVTNGEYRAFIDDGGYRNPLLWLADGWATLRSEQWQAPAYWRRQDDAWYEFTLHGLVALNDDSPVVHLSYYEAEAYAHWAEARLPNEYEWELAAGIPGDVEQRLHPGVARPSSGLSQCFDAAWQWTRSAYLPYPGFKVAAGAVGEYNGKFMSNQMVLKGGACITPRGHTRASYRNFFYAHQRWPFSGLRLTRDR